MKKVMLALCAAAALVLGFGDSRAQKLELPDEAIGIIAEAFNFPGLEPVDAVIIEVQRKGDAEPEVYRYAAQQVNFSSDCASRIPNHPEGALMRFVWCRESSGNAQRDAYFGITLVGRVDEIPCVVDMTVVGNPPWYRLTPGAHFRVC